MTFNRNSPPLGDQAERLRQLAQQSTQLTRKTAGSGEPELRNQSLVRDIDLSGPQIIYVAGSKGGVGATSVGLWMAAAVSRFRSHPIVVIDANPYSNDVWLYRDWYRDGMGRYSQADLWSTVSSQNPLEESFRPLTEQIYVAGGSDRFTESTHSPQRLVQQLLRQLVGLRGRWPIVFLIGGGGAQGWDDSYWSAADRIMVVSSPEVDSILSAYQLIKSRMQKPNSLRVAVAINGGENESNAIDASHRLEHTCRRCLSLDIERIGWIPRMPRSPISEANVVDTGGSVDTSANRLQHFHSVVPPSLTPMLANWLQPSDESGIMLAPQNRETA